MFPRLLRLAFHTIAALNAVSMTLSVSATPIPLPLPLMAADYSLSLVSVNRTTPRLAGQPFHSERGLLSTRSIAPLTRLHGYYNGAVQNSQNLSKRIFFSCLAVLTDPTISGNLATESANAGSDDDDLHRKALSELTGFNENVQGFQTVFTEAISDKGLAYYEKNELLDELLRGIVDANKDTLSATSILINNIPGLGPVLGPRTSE